MSLQGTPSRNEWTMYAVATLLVLFLGALSPVWVAWIADRSKSQESVVQNPVPPSATPAAVSSTQGRGICGVWVSETSRKQYSFVCQGQNLFQVHEISTNGPNNTGSGRVTDEGKVEADLLILQKNRTAHLRLQLSGDGQTMKGAWYGDDPRESGQLTFHRVDKN